MMHMRQSKKHRPGQIRDAIIGILEEARRPLACREIEKGVARAVGSEAASSVRSYLRLNTPELFLREARGVYCLASGTLFRNESAATEARPVSFSTYRHGNAVLHHVDCLDWLRQREDASIHAIVTDPPYGLHEYSPEQLDKMQSGTGGVWRIPPSFDGAKRSPLPRFTVLTPAQLGDLREFFYVWGRLVMPKLVPGANVLIASNPLLSHIVASAISDAGLERRGEIIRLVMTMRGGDRPKAAHNEFPEVSVMPRSMWEPWLVFRRPVEGRVQDNLRKWKTGGFRRPSLERPFGDVIRSGPTRASERALAPHPSLKPQAFMRPLVRAALPLGEGIVADPFAGAGSTLAAAEANGYDSIGLEKDERYYRLACDAIPKLAALNVRQDV